MFGGNVAVNVEKLLWKAAKLIDTGRRHMYRLLMNALWTIIVVKDIIHICLRFPLDEQVKPGSRWFSLSLFMTLS